MISNRLLDFDLHITGNQGDYIARVHRSLGGDEISKFKHPFSDRELEDFIRQLLGLAS
jgi:hypothetical protein